MNKSSTIPGSCTRDTQAGPHAESHIIVVAHEWIFRNGLKQMLLDHDACGTVLEAPDITSVSSQMDNWSKARFLFLELDHPSIDNVESISLMQKIAGRTPIVLLSGDPSREEAVRLLKVGAAGYLSKSESKEGITQAIAAIERGTLTISRLASTKKGQGSDRTTALSLTSNLSHRLDRLSNRQREVLREIGRGSSNNDIAARLQITLNTVKIHVAAILKTLKVKNRTQAALLLRSCNHHL